MIEKRKKDVAQKFEERRENESQKKRERERERERKWKTYGLEIARGDAGEVEGVDRGGEEEEDGGENDGGDGDGGAAHHLLLLLLLPPTSSVWFGVVCHRHSVCERERESKEGKRSADAKDIKKENQVD